MTTQSEYSLAYEQGQASRRNGTPRANHPYRYRRDADLLIERWTDGWDDQDANIRGNAHAN